MNISEKTKLFLRDSQWSQAQLAQAIGVHPVSLNRYLKQRKRESTGERLAAFLESEAAFAVLQADEGAIPSTPTSTPPAGADAAPPA